MLRILARKKASLSYQNIRLTRFEIINHLLFIERINNAVLKFTKFKGQPTSFEIALYKTSKFKFNEDD